MNFNQRQSRSPHSHVKQVLDRLVQEAGAGGRATTSFATICDRISIPRDLRASLLEQLVREGYVTLDGDKLLVTEAGKALANTPRTQTPDDPTPEPFALGQRISCADAKQRQADVTCAGAGAGLACPDQQLVRSAIGKQQGAPP